MVNGFVLEFSQEVRQELKSGRLNYTKKLRVDEAWMVSPPITNHRAKRSDIWRWPYRRTQTCSSDCLTYWRSKCKGLGFWRDRRNRIIWNDELQRWLVGRNHVKYTNNNNQRVVNTGAGPNPIVRSFFQSASATALAPRPAYLSSLPWTSLSTSEEKGSCCSARESTCVCPLMCSGQTFQSTGYQVILYRQVCQGKILHETTHHNHPVSPSCKKVKIHVTVGPAACITKPLRRCS